MSQTKSPSSKSSWLQQAQNIAGFLWNIPKTPKGWFHLTGSMLGDYTLGKEKERWEQLNAGFEQMESRYLGKGAGKLIATWIQEQRESSTQNHLARLEAIVIALDELGHLPIEKALTRFIASKVAIALEGYNSQLHESDARYQRYQKQAKVLLSALPMKNYKGLSQKSIFLGLPFHPETVFIACHRFLDAASIELDTEALKNFLADWENRPLEHPEDYYASLLARSYRQDETEALNQVFENWFDAYRGYRLTQISDREKWLKRGMTLLKGNVFKR